MPVKASTCHSAWFGLLSRDQSRNAPSWAAFHGCISGAFACLRRGRRGVGGRVAGQAPGLHRGAERGRQDRVHVADGARRQALALAVVGAAAALELAVQPVDPLGGQRGQRHRAERRARCAAGCSSGSCATVDGARRSPATHSSRYAPVGCLLGSTSSPREASVSMSRSACCAVPLRLAPAAGVAARAEGRVPDRPPLAGHRLVRPHRALARAAPLASPSGPSLRPRRARGPGARAPARTCRAAARRPRPG